MTEPADAGPRAATVSLDPGVQTSGEDGTAPRLPGAARETTPGADAGRPSHAGPVRGPEVLVGPLAKLERIEDGEAGAFAARFVTDYLSWDEDDPSRRPDVLRGYLADPRASTLGWSGAGRQRADAPLPGRLDRRSDVVVFVEVSLRVTAYARVCPSSDPPVARTDEPSHALGPSSAPAGDPDAWTAGRAWWIQMAVPVTRDQRGQLVVDLSLVPTATGS